MVESTLSVDVNAIAALRSIVEEFLRERLQARLDDLGEHDIEQRAQLQEAYAREAWLADAARRVGQIQLASHTLKAIHPYARGTSIYLSEPHVEDTTLVGTHCLTHERVDDVVCDAKALYVFQFLKLEHDGKTILKRALDSDPALVAALSDDEEKGRFWTSAFASIAVGKGVASSHTLAKQLYFPLDGGGYHMLAPLFPTALVQRLHETLQADRFSDATRDARKARKAGVAWPHGYREYPNLAVVKLGGSNPQNISQLNSKRRGKSPLLASLPPIWQSVRIKPPLRMQSVFARFGAFGGRRAVRELTEALRRFLLRAERRNNVQIRETRAEIVDEIIDELFLFAAQIQTLPSNWSADAACRLDPVEVRWLDPGAAAQGDNESVIAVRPDWFNEIAGRFGNWLNIAINTDRTPMGDDEHLAWKTLVTGAQSRLREDLADED